MSDFLNFENQGRDKDLELDLKDLQSSVAKQSSLYDYWGSKAADARAERDTAVNKLDHMTAQVELEIRKNAAAAGEKLTEAKVSAMVENDPELNALKAVVVEKNRELQRLETKVRALDHKKTMIECAVRLTISKSYEMSTDGVVTDWSAEDSQASIRKSLNHNKDK